MRKGVPLLEICLSQYQDSEVGIFPYFYPLFGIGVFPPDYNPDRFGPVESHMVLYLERCFSGEIGILLEHMDDTEVGLL